MSDFEWNEKIVREFVEYFVKHQGNCPAELWGKDLIETFKASKQPIRDWVVTEIISHGGEQRRLINGEYRIYETGVGFDLDYLLKLDGTIIKSVRRLSDNQTFTVGDEVCDTQKIDNRFTIKKFYIKGDSLMVSHSDYWGININLIEKVQPKPLLTTADGKDIFEYDKFWVVGDAYNIYETSLLPNEKLYSKLIEKTFSTEAAANEYVKNNQPKLSVNNVMEYVRKLCDGTFSDNVDDWNFVDPPSRLLSFLKTHNDSQ